MYPLMTHSDITLAKNVLSYIASSNQLKISNYDSQVDLLITILSFSINGYKKVE